MKRLSFVVALITALMLPQLAEAQSRKSTAAPPRKPPVVTPKRLGKPRTPPDARGRTVLAQADKATGSKILVSTEDRWLWYVVNGDTILSVPVAVGMGKSFKFEDKSFYFETPRGKRTVLSKSENPRWNVPEWHYMERASWNKYGIVKLERSTKYLLKDGSFILTIGDNVGRLNKAGYFWPFDPGLEIMFDNLVFIPPTGTNQRFVPDALGPFKLDTGDGYLIHGTHIYNEDSVGEAVSHGCVRMTNQDLDRLYHMVGTGTPVFIF